MKNTGKTRKLLYALTDIDDKYLNDAIEFARNSGNLNDTADHKKTVNNKNLWIKSALKTALALACGIMIFYGYGIIKERHNMDSTDKDTSNEEIANPCIDVANLSDAEKITGFSIKLPDSGEPYTNEVITVIDKTMIQVSFATEDGSDEGFILRKSAGTGDVSGDYNEYADKVTIQSSGRDITLKGRDNKWYVAVWHSEGYSYSLDAENHPMTEDEIISLIDKTE